MTDTEIARKVLLELFPKGTWAKGARETRIEGKTFERICNGGAIKLKNMEKLKDYPPFAVAYAREKGATEPQLDRKTREVMGRLVRALGPRNLALAALEIESLAALTNPEVALSQLEGLVANARNVLDSKADSDIRQKSE